MKKIFVLSALLLAGFSFVNAQANFDKGDVEFATGIGVFSTFAKDGAATVMPPISARLGFRVSQKFSLAAYAAYSVAELKDDVQPDGSIRELENEFMQLGIRAAVHSSPGEKIDFYGGAMLGYNMPNVTETVNGEPKSAGDENPTFSRPAENNFTYSAFVGASYYPFKKVGLFAEVGYGVSILSSGLTVKF